MPEDLTDIIEDLYEIYNVAAYTENLTLEELTVFENKINRIEQIVRRLKNRKQRQAFVA